MDGRWLVVPALLGAAFVGGARGSRLKTRVPPVPGPPLPREFFTGSIDLLDDFDNDMSRTLDGWYALADDDGIKFFTSSLWLAEFVAFGSWDTSLERLRHRLTSAGRMLDKTGPFGGVYGWIPLRHVDEISPMAYAGSKSPKELADSIIWHLDNHP